MSERVKEAFRRLIGRKLKHKKGLYHYRGVDEWTGLRLHLRTEKDGNGVLVINASRVIFLNRSATEYVRLFMEDKTTEEITREISREFNVDHNTALQDYEDTIYKISTMAKTDDICPVSYLGFEKLEPFKKRLSAPLRMDLALTYRCNNACVHCYVEEERKVEEHSTEQWKKVIDKIVEIGVPHIVFTGGEPTLRDDLAELIKYAELKEVVTGLVTNGRKLKDKDYVNELVKSGLDHIQITLESHSEQIHDKITNTKGSWRETVQGIKNAVATPIYTITNTTLNKHNLKTILSTVRFIHSLGVEQFACNSLIYSGKALKIASNFALNEKTLKSVLPKIKDETARLGMKIIWYTPTQYCLLNPLELELGIRFCSAARINMCIEPNGDVIPCQSYYTPLGNILKDKWEKIWNHPVCHEIRERKYAPDKCNGCPYLNVCGAGCPLQLKNEKYLCLDTMSQG
ncbi:radical SAM protein [Candidatus Bathyarchaeota archaeon]|nr:radical SAM protein [Candidatus Bathyarchaeota archaeon]